MKAGCIKGDEMSQTMAPITVEEIVAEIHDECRLAIPVDYAGVPMGIVAALLRRSPRKLDLLGVPTAGLLHDILIGSGLVRSLETSAVTLGEAGGAPCFMRAIANTSIQMKDSTCPAIHAGLTAAQKGSPFMTMRGLIGTDVLLQRSDWKVMQNPFASNTDPVVIVPALHPDVSVFHAPMADREGNVWIGRRRELAAMAYASKKTYVTVERIVDSRFLDDELTAAGVLPALYVDGIAKVEKGAWPYGLWGEYSPDTVALQRYAQHAKTEEGFKQWISEVHA